MCGRLGGAVLAVGMVGDAVTGLGGALVDAMSVVVGVWCWVTCWLRYDCGLLPAVLMLGLVCPALCGAWPAVLGNLLHAA